MPEHADFSIVTTPYSAQCLMLSNDADDLVCFTCDSLEDRAVLAGAIETTLVSFKVRRKKGD